MVKLMLQTMALGLFYASLLVFLPGCSLHMINITPGNVNATSAALFYCPEASVIRAQDGNRTVDMLSDESGVGDVLRDLGDSAVEVLKP
ncbi:MAG: hypothetical protein V3573_14475 [Desulfovibrionaceae bacterium]